MKTAYSYVSLVLVSVLAVLTVSACGTSTPVPSAPTAQPAPTLPPAKETVIVKETVVVQPTTAPTTNATMTPMPTATAKGAAPALIKTSVPGGKLEFTSDDIEYKPVQRKTDKKVQLTIILHPKGGVPPFSFVLDPGAPVETKIKGLTYTFDWHNCNESEPHTIVLMSADGQKTQPVGFIYPYPCE